MVRLRQLILAQLVESAWVSYWKRDWADFHGTREYLQRFAKDQAVKRLLGTRVYPWWCYKVKDSLDRIGRLLTGNYLGARKTPDRCKNGE